MASRRIAASATFAQTYPNLAWFIQEQGWLELGHETASGYCTSFVRLLDAGGMTWEGKDAYASLDKALEDAERGALAFRKRNGL